MKVLKRSKKAGINAILAKPYTEAELLNTIFDILKLSEVEKISTKTESRTINTNAEDSSSKEFIELYRLANNDEAFVQEMLHMFIKTTEKDLINMQLAYTNQDWHNFAELVHKIKSPCRHLDADELSNMLKELELIARKGENGKLLSEVYENVKIDIGSLIKKVKCHLG